MDRSFNIFLSPPFLNGNEQDFMNAALASGWIAPHGPQLEQFEADIAQFCEVPYALALHSGTSALHLALIMAGVAHGDEVLCPTFTFAALPSMIRLTGASPVFVDCDIDTWNMSLPLASDYLKKASATGKLPKALLLVHNYGVMADVLAFRDLCDEFGVVLIEDAAGALGSQAGSGPAGKCGHYGALSFNGNKLITALGGGALLLHSKNEYLQARKLSLQSKEPSVSYNHLAPGYNYRMNNVAAAFGLAQMSNLEWRIEKKRAIHAFYRKRLGESVVFQKNSEAGNTPWLTAIDTGRDWRPLYDVLKAEGIESRPFWNPLHLQEAYRQHAVMGGEVAGSLYVRGLCLPSGLSLSDDHLEQICEILLATLEGRRLRKQALSPGL